MNSSSRFNDRMNHNGHGNPSGNGNGNGKAHAATGLDLRLPAQHIDAERWTIGAVLMDNEPLHEIIRFLAPEDFWQDEHQVVWRAIVDLYAAGKPIDAILLSDELGRRGHLAQIGGDGGIAAFLRSVPHSANAVFHARIVRDKATTRRLGEVGSALLRASYAAELSADELLEDAERRVFEIADRRSTGEAVSLAQALIQAVARLGERASGNRQVTELPSGFTELDRLTGGFRPGQLVIIAARPSMGKTALAVDICDHIAHIDHKPVLLVSLEMDQVEIADRLLCRRSRVDGAKLRTGFGLGMREQYQLGQAQAEMRGDYLWIDDTAVQSVLQITATARRMKLRKGIAAIVVDYIQLIDTSGGPKGESRQEQVARIARHLKAMAREVGVPVLALAQLNREVEKREDRRPRLADLRESGAIEQDADLVLLLHRPEYYDPNDQPGVAELIVAKHRNGPVHPGIKLTFLKPYATFVNMANVIEPITAADEPF